MPLLWQLLLLVCKYFCMFIAWLQWRLSWACIAQWASVVVVAVAVLVVVLVVAPEVPSPLESCRNVRSDARTPTGTPQSASPPRHHCVCCAPRWRQQICCTFPDVFCDRSNVWRQGGELFPEQRAGRRVSLECEIWNVTMHVKSFCMSLQYTALLRI